MRNTAGRIFRKIFRPERAVTAGMNGIVLLFLLPVLLFGILRIALLLFPGTPEQEARLCRGILAGGGVLYLYAVLSLTRYSADLLRRRQAKEKKPPHPLLLFLILLLPAVNLVVFSIGILGKLRRRGECSDRTGKLLRLSRFFLVISIVFLCCPRTPLFLLLSFLSLLLLCRFLYRTIQSSATAPEETGSAAFPTTFCALVFFLFCTVTTMDVLALREAGRLQDAIAVQAGVSYDETSLELLYREKCPVSDADFDRRIRSPKPGNDLFEQYPELTLRPPALVMSARQKPEIARFFAAQAPVLRKIDTWSSLPGLGIGVDLRHRHIMDARNIFLNWSRLHMLRAELAVAAQDKEAAFRFWKLLRNVRNFIRNMPDQISDFTAASMEPMRIRLWNDMRNTFVFSSAELERFRQEFADDRKEYESSRKLILFRECLELFPPEKTAPGHYLFPFVSGIGEPELSLLNEILQTMKAPRSAEISGENNSPRKTFLRKRLPALHPAAAEKREKNLAVLETAENSARQ